MFYWKCDECDSENLFPDATECETCGALITEEAKRRVLEDIEKEKKRREILIEEEKLRKARRIREMEEQRIALEKKRQQEELAMIEAKRKFRHQQQIMRGNEERVRIATLKKEKAHKNAMIFTKIFDKTSFILKLLVGIMACLVLICILLEPEYASENLFNGIIHGCSRLFGSIIVQARYGLYNVAQFVRNILS